MYYNIVPIVSQNKVYQCLIVLAMIKMQVTTCINTQNVFKNKEILASLSVRIGISGRSLSE